MANKIVTFSKKERLKSQKAIGYLFEHGKKIRTKTLDAVWCRYDSGEDNPVQLGVSVSKKLFKKAVIRNKIKRRVKEAYRKNKIPIFNPLHSQKTRIILMFIYKSSHINRYNEIEKEVLKVFNIVKSAL